MYILIYKFYGKINLRSFHSRYGLLRIPLRLNSPLKKVANEKQT